MRSLYTGIAALGIFGVFENVYIGTALNSKMIVNQNFT